jgi:heptosyltransferase-2
MNIDYFYSSKKNLFVKKNIDFIGYKFFNRNRQKLLLDIKKIKSISIVNLGHIGDMILMLPMLDSLRKGFDGKIFLIVNPYVYDLVKNFKMVDEIIVIKHPKVSRGSGTSWVKAIKDFSGLKVDLVFNADMLFYSIPLCYLIKSNFFIGYNAGGFGFLFDMVLEYPYDYHITERFFRFLDFLKIPRQKIEKLDYYLNININETYEKLNEKYNINRNKFVVIAIGAGAQSKDWDDENYFELTKMLSKLNFNIVLLGKVDYFREDKYKKNFEYNSKVLNLINKTNIIEAISFISNCVFFVGLDSGLTHIAGISGVKTFGIYSGMTGIGVWDPISLNNNVKVIRVDVPCNNKGRGCGKVVCRNNICMKNISSDLVYNFIINNLNKF